MDTHDFILFLVFLLLAATSHLFSKLLFNIGLKIKFRGKLIQWMRSCNTWLCRPIGHLFVNLFLWIAFAKILVPSNDFGVVVANCVLFLLDIYLILVLFWTMHNLAYLILIVLKSALITHKVDHLILQGILEAVGVLLFILFMIGAITALATLTKQKTAIFSLFRSLNLITGVLLMAYSGASKDIVAGLTLFADRPFGRGDLIEVVGVCKAGKVVELRLRVTVLRMLDDALIFIPNNKFFRYMHVNYTQRRLASILVRVPLDKNTPASSVRSLLTALEGYLRANVRVAAADLARLNSDAKWALESRPKSSKTIVDSEEKRALLNSRKKQKLTEKPSSTHHVYVRENASSSVTVDDTMSLCLRQTFYYFGYHKMKFKQSEMILAVTEFLQEYACQVRGKTSVNLHILSSYE